MAWLITIDGPSPARGCAIVVEEAAFDVAYSKLMAAVILARERTNDPVLLQAKEDLHCYSKYRASNMHICGREQRRLRGEISFDVDYCEKGCRGGRRSTDQNSSPLLLHRVSFSENNPNARRCT